MKKYYLGVLIVLGLLLTDASPVFAQADVDPNPSVSRCVSIVSNMRYRDRNNEVFTLQDYLQSNGYLNSEPTGFFGILTRQAVMDFQNANGISPTGYVGPITRAKISNLTNCENAIISIPVTPGCTSATKYSPTTGQLCVKDKEQKFTGYLSSLGATIQMWGSHTLTINEVFPCIMAPCPEVRKSYPVMGKDSKVSASLKLYENSQVTILGQLIWNNFEGGFYGIVASEVISLISPTPIPVPPTPVPVPIPIPNPVPSPISQVTVFSPNGGETWIKETRQTIKWQDSQTYTCPVNALCNPAPRLFDITLAPYQAPCLTNVCPSIVVRPYTIATKLTGYESSRSYTWSVGKTKERIVPDGSYTVSVCVSGSSKCDSSDSYFKIISPTATAPVIYGISGPQSLNIGQEGTWTVKASDPSGGSLSYSVIWGDEAYQPPYGGSSTYSAQQTATFTHRYGTAGTYRPTFTVTNESDQSAKTSLSVEVGGTTPTNALPVLGSFSIPVGVNVDRSIDLSFSATDADNDDLFWSVDWGDSGGALGCPELNSRQKRGWTYRTNHTWNGAGTYTVRVTVSDCRGGVADASFSVYVREIILPSPVTVLFPNGGETWIKNTKQTIKWQDNTPIPACPGAYCANLAPNYYDIQLITYYPPCTGTICPAYPYSMSPYTIAENVYGSSYNWLVGKHSLASTGVTTNYDIAPDTGGIAPDGSYTVQVCQTGTTICDSSDSYFKIKSEQKFTGYLSPLGATVQMWGSHTLTINEVFPCIMAPCPEVRKSYPVMGKDSKVSASLKLYENSQVTILGQLVWNNFEGGFYGIVASEVIPLIAPMSIKLLQPANVLSALDNIGSVEQQTNINTSVSTSCGEFTMTLAKGMNNSEVRCLQKLLNEKGFKVLGVDSGMETTYFGEATLTTLKAFQASKGLTVDGVFGLSSRAALKILLDTN